MVIVSILNIVGLIIELIAIYKLYEKFKEFPKLSQFLYLPMDDTNERLDILIRDLNENTGKVNLELKTREDKSKKFFKLLIFGMAIQIFCTIILIWNNTNDIPQNKNKINSQYHCCCYCH